MIPHNKTLKQHIVDERDKKLLMGLGLERLAERYLYRINNARNSLRNSIGLAFLLGVYIRCLLVTGITIIKFLW